MKKLLVLSHVLPFPGDSGQQQRVKNTLKSLLNHFHVTFVTFGHQSQFSKIEREMTPYCNELRLLPSKYAQNILTRAFYKSLAKVNSIVTGLKPSNYTIGELEFSPTNLSPILEDSQFDCVLFEYWHAFKSVDLFHKYNIPCVLDMHNILRATYLKEQLEKASISKMWEGIQLKKYSKIEEEAWNTFDGIIAINKEEYEYVKTKASPECEIFYTPMGIDLVEWPMIWSPEAGRIRVGYYGGLASYHNQQSANYIYKYIMPRVWEHFPAAEYWIIGSHPTEELKGLSKEDSRVFVTGFVEDVKPILKTMSAVVCPWTGKYGFRSRLIEVMALGIPLVTTEDAVYGMELKNGNGVLISDENSGLLADVLRILSDAEFAIRQSKISRREIERLYSFENTYDKLSTDLSHWLERYDFNG